MQTDGSPLMHESLAPSTRRLPTNHVEHLLGEYGDRSEQNASRNLGRLSLDEMLRPELYSERDEEINSLDLFFSELADGGFV